MDEERGANMLLQIVLVLIVNTNRTFASYDRFLYTAGECPKISNLLNDDEKEDMNEMFFDNSALVWREVARYSTNLQEYGKLAVVEQSTKFRCASYHLAKSVGSATSTHKDINWYFNRRVGLQEPHFALKGIITRYGTKRYRITFQEIRTYLNFTPLENVNFWEDFDWKQIRSTNNSVILWGCDQITNSTNRQSLSILSLQQNQNETKIREMLNIYMKFLEKHNFSMEHVAIDICDTKLLLANNAKVLPKTVAHIPKIKYFSLNIMVIVVISCSVIIMLNIIYNYKFYHPK